MSITTLWYIYWGLGVVILLWYLHRSFSEMIDKHKDTPIDFIMITWIYLCLTSSLSIIWPIIVMVQDTTTGKRLYQKINKYIFNKSIDK
jgi:hypothetical protein